MSKFHIRFNKSRGQPGRGTLEHVWRVFDLSQCPPQEYLAKHFKLEVPSWSEVSGTSSDDYNIACVGKLIIDAKNSGVIIRGKDCCDDSKRERVEK